jgi:hypothetical protein
MANTCNDIWCEIVAPSTTTRHVILNAVKNLLFNGRETLRGVYPERRRRAQGDSLLGGVPKHRGWKSRCSTSFCIEAKFA